VSVLQRKELEESPLADLHAIASELGLEGFRSLRREALIGAILEAQGGEEAIEVPPEAAEDRPAVEEDEEEPPVEGPPAGEAPPPPAEPSEPEAPELEEAVAEEEPIEEEPEVVEQPPTEEETVTGPLDVLPNGSGFVRVDPAGQSRDDVYVSPAQIRRCELRAGDEVGGPLRPPRRNERHPSLVRVETVNGRPAEPPEERPRFTALTPVFPTERLAAPSPLEGVPFGKGSRVAVGGPPGAGATTLLREVSSTLAERHPEVELAVVLVGVRPEEVTEWRAGVSAPVVGGGFDRSTETQVQAAELATEQAKRTVERGGDAALVIDSLEALPPAAQRRIFGAARNTEEGGSLTIVAAIGMGLEPQRFASTRVVLDPPAPGSPAPKVSSERSTTLRADLLG
jgi:transcription termination factor Rho